MIDVSKYSKRLLRLAQRYSIPKEKVEIVSDVAKRSIELGWEKEGDDTNKERMAKVKHDIDPPHILLRSKIRLEAGKDIVDDTFLSEKKKDVVRPTDSDHWTFLKFLLLHEIGHSELNHANRTLSTEASETEKIELKILNDVEADEWALKKVNR